MVRHALSLIGHSLIFLCVVATSGCFTTAVVGAVSSSALTVETPRAFLAKGASLTLNASGGATPYTLSASAGTVSGLTYTAPASVTDDSDDVVLTLTDAAGDKKEFPLRVYSPGELDRSFGIDNMGMNIALNVGGFNALTLDRQDRIYVGTRTARIVRFSADGLQDMDYHGGALVITLGAGYTTHSIEHAFTDSQGRLVFSGNALNGPAGNWQQGFVVRLTASGELDASFGSGGKVIIPFGSTGSDLIRSVAEDSQRRLLVAGRSSASGGDMDFAVARLLENGAMDTTYGTSGWAKVENPGYANLIQHVFLQPGSDTLYFVGRAWDTPTSAYASAFGSLLPDGTSNPSLPGHLITALGSHSGSAAYSAFAQDDQHWIVGGHGTNGSVDDLTLTRINITGPTIDTTFGTSGVLTINIHTTEQINKVMQGANSKILACGSSIDFRLIRTTPNGTLDTTFGPSGRRSVDFGVNTVEEGCRAMQLDSKGRIIAAGWSGASSGGILRMWD